MLRPLLACVTAIACGAAHAADLPPQTRQGTQIGAIFAEPAGPRAVVLERPIERPRYVYAPQVDIPPLVNGYYGKPNSYLYENYYGTSPVTIFGRLPYACGFYGYC